MIDAQEFNQLIAILPRLEQFAQAHQLTSLSLVKTADPQRAEADLYVCYTHEGDEHSLDTMAEIDRLFTQLWGLPLFNGIISAQDKARFDPIKFEQRFQPTEIFLLRTNEDNTIHIATSNEIVEYAKRQFDIICDPVIASSRINSEANKKRKTSDEKDELPDTATISSSNIFSKAPSETPIKKIEDAIERLSQAEFQQLMINISRKHDISNITNLANSLNRKQIK